MLERLVSTSLAGAASTLVLAACTGYIESDAMPAGAGTSPSGAVAVGECAGPLAGTLTMRRLTRTEYDHSVRDLLGDTSRPAQGFPADDAVGHLLNNITSPVTALLVEKYRDAAEAGSARALAMLPSLLSPCDPAVSGETVCARQLIESFGGRAFRRPLEATELDALMRVYDGVYADIGLAADFATRVRVVLGAMLQAPSFLYRAERGAPLGDAPGIVKLDDYEVATRLSYALWASTPDEALLAAAERQELGSVEGIDRQVQRMLLDAKFVGAVDSFHSQWLGLDELSALVKDQAVYPEFQSSLRTAMHDEIRSFLEEVVVRGDARVETLLTSRIAFVTPELAALYGVQPPAGTMAKVELPAGERAGLLTRSGFLAMHADPNQSSPIKRGVAVRERLLCQGLPPPVADIPEPEPPKPGATTRERFASHTSVEGCAACHLLIDPIGFGFESYDGVGRFRASEAGRPIDSSGELTSAAGVEGPFVGAVELSERLARSDGVRACIADFWFRFAAGARSDACTQARINAEFAATDYDIRKLLAAIARSDAFRYARLNP